MKEEIINTNTTESDEVKSEQVETEPTEKYKSKKKKKGTIIAIAVGLAIIVGIMSFSGMKKSNYIKDLKEVHMLMLEGGSVSEEITSLTSKVWYNSIHEESSPETDKYCAYTLIDSIYATVFYHGFNESIQNMYKDKEIIAKIDDVKANQDEVRALMKKLQNPPSKYKECYRVLLDMYDNYNSITDLAISPKGSYNDFSDMKNSAIDNLVTLSKKLDAQLP